MVLIPALLVPIVFCMALARLVRIPLRLHRGEMALPGAHRRGLWLATVLAYMLLLAWTLGLAVALARALLLAPDRLQAVLHLWAWMLAYPPVYFLTAWVFFYGLRPASKPTK